MVVHASFEELAAENVRLRRRVAELEAALAALFTENDALRERLAELEAALKHTRDELEEARGASKRQAAPFRRKEREAQPKRPGREKGHPAAHRPVPQKIDRTLEAKLLHATCLKCGGELRDHTTQVQYQVDIPPVEPVVTQFNVEVATCAGCGQRFQARHPEQTSDALGAAEVQIGPRALGLAAEMKHGLGVPYRKVAHVLEQALGLELAPSTLARADQRLAEKAKPTYAKLISTLRDSVYVNVDETGWYLSGENAWLWVFTTDGITLYRIIASRAHEVAEEVLGRDFAGVIGCDSLLTYDALNYRQQKDFTHLLRRTGEMQEKGGVVAEFARRVASLLRDALSLWHQREQMPKADYPRERQRLEEVLDRLLAKEQPDPDNERLAKLLSKHRSRLFTFLYVEGVEPTNAAAEREIRPAVVVRKISAGNRSDAGAEAHAILTSLLRTCQKRGLDFLQVVADLLHHRLPEAINILREEADAGGANLTMSAAQPSGP
jgi:transposase